MDILAPTATYEIQWGNIERPTHKNTSWDWAKFEVPAQKWVDLSEGGYGVSLLNDCKYGHDIQGNVLRLSLLRGTTYPDPHADQGEHHFTYSLLPHQGGWGIETISNAYALNNPPLAWRKGETSSSTASGVAGEEGGWSFLRMDRPTVVIETVKVAENGEGFIVRLYESRRERGLCELSSGISLDQVIRTNLLEEDLENLDVESDAVRLSISPYEIVHLRLIPTER